MSSFTPRLVRSRSKLVNSTSVGFTSISGLMVPFTSLTVIAARIAVGVIKNRYPGLDVQLHQFYRYLLIFDFNNPVTILFFNFVSVAIFLSKYVFGNIQVYCISWTRKGFITDSKYLTIQSTLSFLKFYESGNVIVILSIVTSLYDMELVLLISKLRVNFAGVLAVKEPISITASSIPCASVFTERFRFYILNRNISWLGIVHIIEYINRIYRIRRFINCHHFYWCICLIYFIRFQQMIFSIHELQIISLIKFDDFVQRYLLTYILRELPNVRHLRWLSCQCLCLGHNCYRCTMWLPNDVNNRAVAMNGLLLVFSIIIYCFIIDLLLFAYIKYMEK